MQLKGKLTNKQKRFVQEYVIDFNATQAAIRSGYSQRSANNIGATNLAKPNIQKAIALEIEARTKRTEIDADWVVARLVDNVNFAIQLHNPAAVNGALQLLSRHTGGFDDRIHVDYGSKELFELL